MKLTLLIIYVFVLVANSFAGLKSYNLKPALDAITEYMDKQADYVIKKKKVGTWKQIGFTPDIPTSVGRLYELGKGSISFSPDYDARTSKYEQCDLILDPSLSNFKFTKDQGGFKLISFDYVDRQNKRNGNHRCEEIIQALQLSAMDNEPEIMTPDGDTPVQGPLRIVYKTKEYSEAGIDTLVMIMRNVIWNYVVMQYQYYLKNQQLGSFRDLSFDEETLGMRNLGVTSFPFVEIKMVGYPDRKFRLQIQKDLCDFHVQDDVIAEILESKNKGISLDSIYSSGIVTYQGDGCESLAPRILTVSRPKKE